jgi:hypothetical protein
MKNKDKKMISGNNEMLGEYDFTGEKGVRGKYYQAYRQGHTVKIYEQDGTVNVQYFALEEGSIMLDPDIRKYFPNSDVVNSTLRSLISLLPKNQEKSIVVPKFRTIV